MQLPAGIRRVTDPLLANVRVPIVGGVNRGLWWSLISSGSGYASGRRAAAQMQLIQELVHDGDVMWDIGAHHGYVTLAASRKVGHTGSVHAFEPSEMNRARLTRHVRWNSLANVAVHPYALADYCGECTFGGAGTSKMYSMGGGTEVVQVRSSCVLVQEKAALAPSFVKIDVEGAEADTIAGLLSVLPPNARLFIAMHNAEVDRKVTAMLQLVGFTCMPSRELTRSRDNVWQSDPDLFCMGPAYLNRDQDMAALARANF